MGVCYLRRTFIYVCMCVCVCIQRMYVYMCIWYIWLPNSLDFLFQKSPICVGLSRPSHVSNKQSVYSKSTSIHIYSAHCRHTLHVFVASLRYAEYTCAFYIYIVKPQYFGIYIYTHFTFIHVYSAYSRHAKALLLYTEYKCAFCIHTFKNDRFMHIYIYKMHIYIYPLRIKDMRKQPFLATLAPAEHICACCKYIFKKDCFWIHVHKMHIYTCILCILKTREGVASSHLFHTQGIGVHLVYTYIQKRFIGLIHLFSKRALFV